MDTTILLLVCICAIVDLRPEFCGGLGGFHVITDLEIGVFVVRRMGSEKQEGAMKTAMQLAESSIPFRVDLGL